MLNEENEKMRRFKETEERIRKYFSLLGPIDEAVWFVNGEGKPDYFIEFNKKQKNTDRDDKNHAISLQVMGNVLGWIREEEKQKIITPESPTIWVSPINEKALQYLAEDPKRFFELESGDFEEVITEIYRRAGYDAMRTQQTRDGGKDIVLRKSDLTGDYIFYVECKRHRKNVGIGIIREFHSVVETDKVNGGTIVTTSHFTKDAWEYIQNNQLSCRIQGKDLQDIQTMLRRVL